MKGEKEMAKVCCNHPIGNYRRCENDDFIIHSNNSMQCSKCGYFFKDKEVEEEIIEDLVISNDNIDDEIIVREFSTHIYKLRVR